MSYEIGGWINNFLQLLHYCSFRLLNREGGTLFRSQAEHPILLTIKRKWTNFYKWNNFMKRWRFTYQSSLKPCYILNSRRSSPTKFIFFRPYPIHYLQQNKVFNLFTEHIVLSTDSAGIRTMIIILFLLLIHSFYRGTVSRISRSYKQNSCALFYLWR